MTDVYHAVKMGKVLKYAPIGINIKQTEYLSMQISRLLTSRAGRLF